MNIPEMSWNQEHYDQAKEIIPDDVEFQGPGGHGSTALEFDMGKAMDVDELQDATHRTVGAFEAHGVSVKKSYVKAGYAGAMNASLLLVIKFEEPENQ